MPFVENEKNWRPAAPSEEATKQAEIDYRLRVERLKQVRKHENLVSSRVSKLKQTQKATELAASRIEELAELRAKKIAELHALQEQRARGVENLGKAAQEANHFRETHRERQERERIEKQRLEKITKKRAAAALEAIEKARRESEEVRRKEALEKARAEGTLISKQWVTNAEGLRPKPIAPLEPIRPTPTHQPVLTTKIDYSDGRNVYEHRPVDVHRHTETSAIHANLDLSTVSVEPGIVTDEMRQRAEERFEKAIEEDLSKKDAELAEQQAEWFQQQETMRKVQQVVDEQKEKQTAIKEALSFEISETSSGNLRWKTVEAPPSPPLWNPNHCKSSGYHKTPAKNQPTFTKLKSGVNVTKEDIAREEMMSTKLPTPNRKGDTPLKILTPVSELPAVPPPTSGQPAPEPSLRTESMEKTVEDALREDSPCPSEEIPQLVRPEPAVINPFDSDSSYMMTETSISSMASPSGRSPLNPAPQTTLPVGIRTHVSSRLPPTVVEEDEEDMVAMGSPTNNASLSPLLTSGEISDTANRLAQLGPNDSLASWSSLDLSAISSNWQNSGILRSDTSQIESSAATSSLAPAVPLLGGNPTLSAAQDLLRQRQITRPTPPPPQSPSIEIDKDALISDESGFFSKNEVSPVFPRIHVGNARTPGRGEVRGPMGRMAQALRSELDDMYRSLEGKALKK